MFKRYLLGFTLLIVALFLCPALAQQEKFARDRVFDLQHVRCEFSFDIPKRKLSGRVTHVLSPLHTPLNAVELDAGDGLQIKQVVNEKAQSLKHVKANGKLTVDLGKTYLPTEKVTLAITYEVAMPTSGGFVGAGLRLVVPDDNNPTLPTQIWSLNEPDGAAGWIPCYDYPNDKCASEVLLTVPKNMMGISNGTLAATRTNADGTKTFHWKQDLPHSTYLISVAVGEFVEVKDTPYENVPIVYYVPKYRPAEEAKAAMSNTRRMVKFFSDRIGVRYPWSKYAQVMMSNFPGGMEHTSATTMGDFVLHDDRAHLDVSSDSIIAHELAHQWWGDLLTCKDWSHVWLNEGFASYFDTLWTEFDQGKDAFQIEVDGMMNGARAADAGNNRRPVVYRQYAEPEQMFDGHAYPKGGSVLHTLRGVLGDDLFWKGINLYARRNAFKAVETVDLRLAMEEVSGRDLTWFFEQWLYKAGYPEFQVRYSWDGATKKVKVTVKQTQQVTNVTPLFRTPVDVYVTTAQGQQKHRVYVEQASHEFIFDAASPPLMVNFDPEQWVLKTLDFPKSKEEWLYTLRHAPWAVERQRAVSELGKIKGDPAVLVALRDAALNDKFYGIRRSATQAFSQQATSPEVRDGLLKIAQDKDSRVRRAALEALGAYAQEAPVQKTLEDAFHNDRSYYAQEAALRSLVKGKAPNVADLLTKAMGMNSHNEVLRAAALYGFAELNDKRGVPIALDAIVRFYDFGVRRAAESLLTKFAADESTRRDLRAQLVSRLKTAPAFSRVTFISVLSQMKDEETAAVLQQIADDTNAAQSLRDAARAVALRIREGLPKTPTVAELQATIQKLEIENKQLKERVKQLEEQGAGKNGGKQ